LKTDLAGALVAVPPLLDQARFAQRQDVSSIQESTGDGTVGGRQLDLPTNFDEPVYSIPASLGNPGNRELLDEFEHPEENPGSQEPSPSDQLERTQPPGDSVTANERATDRPWLPLVGAIAVASGFLAGNLFQWRSYMSLRKRYLHLLRKTGG
jgi:hypothetical protein